MQAIAKLLFFRSQNEFNMMEEQSESLAKFEGLDTTSVPMFIEHLS